jgi:predicted nucleotide-binding protein (sugar kinase/HSP70/actin superfamily)
MVAFEKYVEAIKKDVEDDKYVAWKKAYQDVMEKLGHSKRDEDKPLQQARYKPNLSVVYEGF